MSWQKRGISEVKGQREAWVSLTKDAVSLVLTLPLTQTYQPSPVNLTGFVPAAIFPIGGAVPALILRERPVS